MKCKSLVLMPEFILMKWFLENSLVTKGWKLVARGTNHVTKRVRTFNPSLWPLRKREEVEFESITNGQWFNQSCFSIESSIKKTNNQTKKTLKSRVWSTSWLRAYADAGRRQQENREACAPPAYLPHTNTDLLSGASELYLFIINW